MGNPKAWPPATVPRNGSDASAAPREFGAASWRPSVVRCDTMPGGDGSAGGPLRADRGEVQLAQSTSAALARGHAGAEHAVIETPRPFARHWGEVIAVDSAAGCRRAALRQLVLYREQTLDWVIVALCPDLSARGGVGQGHLGEHAAAVTVKTTVDDVADAPISWPVRRRSHSVSRPQPGFPRWIGSTGPKAAETLAKLRIPPFTRRVRQDSAADPAQEVDLLRPVDIHLSARAVAARLIMAAKLWSVLS